MFADGFSAFSIRAMQVTTVADQLFFITGFVQGEAGDRSWSGTAFVHEVATDVGSVSVLVSNKHVLTGAERLTVRFVQGDPASPGSPLLGKATQITIEQPSTLVVSHPDAAVDVAVMALGPVLEAMSAQAAPPFIRPVGEDLMLSAERAGELDSIEEVIFVGYPNAIFDTTNFTPVARRGTTATPIGLDYRGEPAFLVDATVFPGSSGSPVFLRNTGTYQSRDGSTVVGGRVFLLGVLAAVHTAQVGGQIVASLPASRAVEVQTPIGLGIVYRAETVDTCVDLFLAQHGVRRKIASPPDP